MLNFVPTIAFRDEDAIYVTNYLQVFLIAIDVKYYPKDIVQSMYKPLAPREPSGTVEILRHLSPEGWGTCARFEHY